MRAAVRRPRQRSSSSATRTRPTSTVRDRIGPTLSAPPGGHRRRAGHPGLRPRGRRERRRFRAANRALYDAHMRVGADPAWYLPVIEFAGARHHRAGRSASAAGWCTAATSSRSARSPLFVLLLSNLFEPVQQLCQLFNMVQSAGAGAEQAVRAARHARGRRATPARSTCRQRGDLGGRRRHVRLRRRTSRVLRDVDLVRRRRRAARAGRARPAPASRRWPS